MTNEAQFIQQMKRILTPLARLSIHNGIKFSSLSRALKASFVDAAENHFAIDGKKTTASRISLLTGIARRDITENIQNDEEISSVNQLIRVHSHLLARDEKTILVDDFESLVRSLYQDVHPRTFLDELIRLGLLTREDDLLLIAEASFIDAKKQAVSIQIFTDNLSAHLHAGVSNMMGAPPMLEQAVFATGLHEDDVLEFQRISRALSENLLRQLNGELIDMQSKRSGRHKVRLGIYLDKMEIEE